MRVISVWGESDDNVIFRNVDIATSVFYKNGGGRKDPLPRFQFKDGFFGASIYSNGMRSRFLLCNKILLHSFYGTDHTPVWCFAVSRMDADDDYPNWKTEIKTHESGYSMQVDIHVPDEVKEIRVDQVHQDAIIVESDMEFWKNLQSEYSTLIAKINFLLDEPQYSKTYKSMLTRIKAVFYPRDNLQQVMTRDEAIKRRIDYPSDHAFFVKVHIAICDIEDRRRHMHVISPIE